MLGAKRSFRSVTTRSPQFIHSPNFNSFQDTQVDKRSFGDFPAGHAAFNMTLVQISELLFAFHFKPTCTFRTSLMGADEPLWTG
jgi:hypothetical protein